MFVSPLIPVFGFAAEPDATYHHSEKRLARGALVEPQWFSDFITRIRVLHLWWYVATADAIKIRNNVFLATGTIHSFILYLSRDT